MLGHKVCQELTAYHRVVGTLRGSADEAARYSDVLAGCELVSGVDVLEDASLRSRMEAHQPDFVVNAVGIVKQLDAASDPYLSVAINSLLPHRLAKLCAGLDSHLIHISTDCVFSGRRGGYRDDDPSDADDLYGRSKSLGETLPGQSSAVTLRTSFIGRELKRPHHGLVEWFLSERGGRVRGFAGAIYTGLTSLELARVVRRVVEHPTPLAGTHQVASKAIDKDTLLRLVRDAYDIDIEIERAETPHIDRSLLMRSFTDATGYQAPSWEQMIREMAEDPTPYDEYANR